MSFPKGNELIGSACSIGGIYEPDNDYPIPADHLEPENTVSASSDLPIYKARSTNIRLNANKLFHKISYFQEVFWK
jgi:hypothetical protein